MAIGKGYRAILLSLLAAWPSNTGQAQLLPLKVEVTINPGPFVVLPAEKKGLVKQVAKEGDLFQRSAASEPSAGPPVATLSLFDVDAELAQLTIRMAELDEALKDEGFNSIAEGMPGEAPIKDADSELSTASAAALTELRQLVIAEIKTLRTELLHPAASPPVEAMVLLAQIRASHAVLVPLSEQDLRKAILDASTFCLRSYLPEFIFVDARRRRAVRPNSTDLLQLEVPALTEPEFARDSLDELTGYWRTVKDLEVQDSQDESFLASLHIHPLALGAEIPPIDRFLEDLSKARAAVEEQVRLLEALRAMSPFVPWNCATMGATPLWSWVFSPPSPIPPRFTTLSDAEKNLLLTHICTVKTVIKGDKESELMAEWYAAASRKFRLDFKGKHLRVTEDRTGQPIGKLDFEPGEFGPFTAPMSLLWSQTAIQSPGGLQTGNVTLLQYRVNEYGSAIQATLAAPYDFTPSTRMEYQKQIIAQRAQLEVEQQLLAHQHWREGRALLASKARLLAGYQEGRIWAPEALEITAVQVEPGGRVELGEPILTAVPTRRRSGSFRVKAKNALARYLSPGARMQLQLEATAGPNLSLAQIRRLKAASNQVELRTILRKLFEQYAAGTQFEVRALASNALPDTDEILVEIDIQLLSPAAPGQELLTVPAAGIGGQSKPPIEAMLSAAGLWETISGKMGVPLPAGSLRRGDTFDGHLTFTSPEARERFSLYAESMPW